jgi:hypothetical protein
VKWLRFPRVLGLLVCGYLLGIAVIFGYHSTLSFRFVSNAVSTQGTVVELVPRSTAGSTRPPGPRTPNPPTAPRVTYTVNGIQHSYTPQHGRYRQRLKVGDTVLVQYNPDNPAQARLRGEGRILLPLLTSGFVTAAIAVGALLFLTRRVGAGTVPARQRALPEELAGSDDGQRLTARR